MSIYFNHVRYKNILSTGNNWTEIQLNRNKSTLIIGENGAGKSTMLDAICFALYGKPFRKINKPQLMNSINQKALEVEVSFDISTNKYLIKRGMKPNIFEIWKNGELLNQDAASRDYQVYLEQNILKMNFKSFGQVVVLGSSTFVPFMQLPSQHRREIIEDLLDIQIFSTMNILLKDKVNNNKTDITDIKYKIELLNNNIESAKSHNESIRKIKETEVSKIKEKIKDRVSYIEEQNSYIESVNITIDDLLTTITDETDVKQKLSNVVDVINKLNTKQSQLLKEVSFYENYDNCPTCKQGIDHEFKDGTITEHRVKVSQISDGQSELTLKIEKFQKRLKEIESIKSEIAAANLNASEHRANVKLAMSVLKGLKAELENAEEEVEAIDTSKIEDLELQLTQHHTKQSELSQDRETLLVVGSMLKDGGIKTRIIKQYVPVMNKLINKYLSAMDFFVQFELNENFEETIKSRFRDVFSYGSFSEGEKAKIDISLLLTWRSIAAIRNSTTTNLLIMDEVFDGSMDANSVESLQKILLDIINTYNVNLFVISHMDQRVEGFDSALRVKKYNNFSQIEYVDI